jgi:hypothetical protein
LLNIRPATPQESLVHVNDLLKQPDNYIRFRQSTLKLDKMGIVIDAHASRPCNNIDLTEVLIGNDQPRVVTLAQFPLAEFSPYDHLPAHRLFS